MNYDNALAGPRQSIKVEYRRPNDGPGIMQQFDYGNTRRGWKDYYYLYNALERIANRQSATMPPRVRNEFAAEMRNALAGRSTHDNDAWIAKAKPWNDSHYTMGDPRNALANALGMGSNFVRTLGLIGDLLTNAPAEHVPDRLYRRDIDPDEPQRQHKFLDDNRMTDSQKIKATRQFHNALGLPTPDITAVQPPQRRP